MKKFDSTNYEFDDGVDPRDLLPKKAGSKLGKGRKLFHETWAEKIAEEQSDVYYEEDIEKKEKAEKKANTTPIDHDRNSKGKSPMIPVPKHLVATDELGAPKEKKRKKISFRKLVKNPRKGGNSKKV